MEVNTVAWSSAVIDKGTDCTDKATSALLELTCIRIRFVVSTLEMITSHRIWLTRLADGTGEGRIQYHWQCAYGRLH